MIKEMKLFVALVLVTTFVSCHAAPLEESENNAVADSRPIVNAEVNGLLFEVPVYEDLVFTEQKRELDAKNFGIIKNKLLVVAKLVIVERKGFISVAREASGFIGLFKNFMKTGNELSKTDTSPKIKKTFGPEMSKLVETVLKTNSELTNLSDQENYERVETLMNGIETLIQRSPTGLYLDWNKLTIDGETLPVYISPVISWLRRNRYGPVLNIVGMVGGLFKNIGNQKG